MRIQFGLRHFLITIVVIAMILALNVRVTPYAEVYEISPPDTNDLIGQFLVVRCWPLSPCMFATCDVDGIESISTPLFWGIIAFDAAIAWLTWYLIMRASKAARLW